MRMKQWVRGVRAKTGLRGRDFAKLIGASESTLYSWIGGRQLPSKKYIRILKRVEKEYGPVYTLTKEEIKTTRVDLGLTREQMAKRAGVSLSLYEEWERGNVIPRSDQVDKILGIRRKHFVKKPPNIPKLTKEQKIMLRNELFDLTNNAIYEAWEKDPEHVTKVQAISRALGLYGQYKEQ